MRPGGRPRRAFSGSNPSTHQEKAHEPSEEQGDSSTKQPQEASARALAAITDIAAAVACGQITPAQADALTRVVHRFIIVHESVELERRVTALEKHAGLNQPAPRPPEQKPADDINF